MDARLPVMRRLTAAAVGRRPDPILAAAAPRVGSGQVGGLAREFAISERQLRRRFHAAAGYGPGTLRRILRFRRFLAFRSRRWGPTAASCMP